MRADMTVLALRCTATRIKTTAIDNKRANDDFVAQANTEIFIDDRIRERARKGRRQDRAENNK